MPDWKILITDGLDAAGVDILRAAAQVDEQRGISAAELADIISVYHALIVRSRTKVGAKLLARAGQLKVIGRAGVGVDNIDLEAARERDIRVVNSPLATTLAVAELTLGLLLALARQIPAADAAMKSGRWTKKELLGSELSGKQLGIIGVGNIGSAVARRAEALGMTALGYDPFLDAEQVRRQGAEPVGLADLYARADYISLHVPLSEQTQHLIAAQAFERMKPGVRIVCTARGGIINEPDLLAALESGKVAGAALDVFANEPPGATSLVTHPAVIATPHIAAQTAEAQERAAVDIATEALAALRGERLRWQIV